MLDNLGSREWAAPSSRGSLWSGNKEYAVNIWVQKSRLMLKRGRRGWHCKTYLDGVGNDPNERFGSGGRNSTKSPQSMACIRQMQPGDLVLLYQVDDESFYAITQTDSCGMEADPGSRQYNLVYLKPAVTAFRFAKPLTLAELRASGCSPACFEPGENGRMFPLTTEDLVGIATAAAQVNPDQTKDLAAWLRERS